MRCTICKHGQTQPGYATVMLHRGEAAVIIREVPADICDNCGEYFLSESVTAEVLARAERAAQNGVEIEVLRYAA